MTRLPTRPRHATLLMAFVLCVCPFTPRFLPAQTPEPPNVLRPDPRSEPAGPPDRTTASDPASATPEPADTPINPATSPAEPATSPAEPATGPTEPATSPANPPAAPAVTPDQTLPTINLEEVTLRLKALDESTDVSDELRKSLREAYDEARRSLEAAAQSQRQRQQFEQWIAELPEDLRKAEEALATPVPQYNFEQLDSKSGNELRSDLEELDQKLKRAKTDLEALRAESARRTARQVEIPKLIAAEETRRLESVEKFKLTPSPDTPPPLVEARRIQHAANARRAEAEAESLAKEALAYEKQVPLLSKRMEQANRLVSQFQPETEKLRPFVATRNLAEARIQAEEVWKSLPAGVQQDEHYASLIERIETLVEAREQCLLDTNAETAELAELERQLTETEEGFRLATQRVESGATAAIGQNLRNTRSTLPSPRALQRNIAARSQLIRQVQTDLYNRERRWSSLQNMERAVEQEWAALPGLPADSGDPLEAVTALLRGEKVLLESLIADTKAYLKLLVELDLKEQQYVDEVVEFSQFIDENVFWVRSTAPLTLGDVGQARDAVWYLLSVPRWAELGRRWWADVRARWPVYAAAVLAVVVLGYFQSRLRRRIHALGQSVSHSPYVQFGPTLHVLLLTLLISVPWPALLLFLASCLSRFAHADSGDFARSLATTCIQVSVVLAALLVLYQTCRSQGLAQAHFGWPKHVLAVIRRNVRWIILVGVPLAFVVRVLHAATLQSPLDGELEGYHNSLGRLAFIAFHLLLTGLFYVTFRPRNGVFQEHLGKFPGGWLDRLKWIWFLGTLSVPLTLAVLAILGFYDTALQLTQELELTALWVFALVLIGALLRRWLMLTQRKLAIRQALEGRSQTVAIDGDMAKAAAHSPVNLSVLNVQVQKLIYGILVLTAIAGVLVIWSDVLPALGFLDDLRVYQLEPDKWLTATDLCQAAILLLITIMAARNGPSLIEILLLQRLPLHSSVHYAIKSVAQYVIAAIGMLLVANRVGLNWDKLVWLLAPLGVGLGFGLQEVFANFVCGLILLFEQPIRIGDIVTIGDTTGAVTRIRIRATTIRNWDRQELLIPNKELITGKLINWTLTDTVNRITIPVGVAYGSDTDRARSVLFEILREHPDVLDDPEPLVTFEGFGDSTLNIVIRAYLSGMENRLSAIHEIHTRINKRFHQEKIEIAFPQRDLHLRTMPPGWQYAPQGNGSARQPAEPPEHADSSGNTGRAEFQGASKSRESDS